jgi:hemerythrin-like domain-containing protein
MLRDKNLIPLSHQHQHALALCVRIDRAVQAGNVDLKAWQAEIQQIYEAEIFIHFAAEEKELFPAATKFRELANLVQELLSEHVSLRDLFDGAAIGAMTADALTGFAKTLSTHIRKEERQLFERMQQLMSQEELSVLGRGLDKQLEAASNSCALPSAATRIRPQKKP